MQARLKASNTHCMYINFGAPPEHRNSVLHLPERAHHPWTAIMAARPEPISITAAMALHIWAVADPPAKSAGRSNDQGADPTSKRAAGGQPLLRQSPFRSHRPATPNLVGLKANQQQAAASSGSPDHPANPKPSKSMVRQ
ncbi:hypothetical protein ACLOJK_006788 [Asimina triloba]